MLKDFYDQFVEIGKGSFGTVYTARERCTEKTVAVKVLDKKIHDKNLIDRSRNIIQSCLARLDHQFIVHYYECFEDDNKLSVVMEYVPNGSLLDFINYNFSKDNCIQEDMIKVYILQLIEILDYLHNSAKVIHRDLKTENILIDKFGNLRLTDFGFSKVFIEDNLINQTQCGSPSYTAPEIIMNTKYNSSADIWSVGVIIYAMAYGQLPFEAKNMSQSFQQVILKEPKYDDALVSPELNSLIRAMLTKSAEQRITLKEIRNHPYVLKYHIPHYMVSDPNDLSRIVIYQMSSQFGIDGRDLICDLNEKKVNHKTAIYKLLNTDRIYLDLMSVQDMPKISLSNMLQGSRSVKAESVPLTAGKIGSVATRSSPAVMSILSNNNTNHNSTPNSNNSSLASITTKINCSVTSDSILSPKIRSNVNNNCVLNNHANCINNYSYNINNTNFGSSTVSDNNSVSDFENDSSESCSSQSCGGLGINAAGLCMGNNNSFNHKGGGLNRRSLIGANGLNVVKLPMLSDIQNSPLVYLANVRRRTRAVTSIEENQANNIVKPLVRRSMDMLD